MTKEFLKIKLFKIKAEQIDFKDADFRRLQQTSITPTIIKENLLELKELQPNLFV